MRIRTIKPSFFKDDRLAACSPLARILFAGLWCMADRNGCLVDRPQIIKVEALPHDVCDIVALLDELAAGAHPFIKRYEVAGTRYIIIPGFTTHQRITGTEATNPAVIPMPLEASPRKQRGSIKETLRKQRGSTEETQEGKGREGKGEEAVPVSPPDTPDPTPRPTPPGWPADVCRQDRWLDLWARHCAGRGKLVGVAFLSPLQIAGLLRIAKPEAWWAEALQRVGESRFLRGEVKAFVATPRTLLERGPEQATKAHAGDYSDTKAQASAVVASTGRDPKTVEPRDYTHAKPLVGTRPPADLFAALGLPEPDSPASGKVTASTKRSALRAVVRAPPTAEEHAQVLLLDHGFPLKPAHDEEPQCEST
jgi:hypothetical protein